MATISVCPPLYGAIFLTVMPKYSKSKFLSRGRILGCNWDKILRVFLLAIHSHLNQRNLLPPAPLSKGGLKLDCNANNVYGNLKSENSQ